MNRVYQLLINPNSAGILNVACVVGADSNCNIMVKKDRIHIRQTKNVRMTYLPIKTTDEEAYLSQNKGNISVATLR